MPFLEVHDPVCTSSLELLNKIRIKPWYNDCMVLGTSTHIRVSYRNLLWGGGNFVSGEQWAWEAWLPGGGGGGGLGVPQNIFEKVSALRVRDLATKH